MPVLKLLVNYDHWTVTDLYTYVAYLLNQTPWLYSRAAFIKLSVIGEIFGKCKGFEKSKFYKINKELRCSDLVLKQTF